jgi:hypothetical protein
MSGSGSDELIAASVPAQAERIPCNRGTLQGSWVRKPPENLVFWRRSDAINNRLGIDMAFKETKLQRRIILHRLGGASLLPPRTTSYEEDSQQHQTQSLCGFAHSCFVP